MTHEDGQRLAIALRASFPTALIGLEWMNAQNGHVVRVGLPDGRGSRTLTLASEEPQVRRWLTVNGVPQAPRPRPMRARTHRGVQQ